MSLLVHGIKMQTRPICADGWTLSSDERSCVKIDTMNAVNTGSNLTTQHFANTAYSVWGTVIYKQGNVNQDGTWELGNSSTYPNVYTTKPQMDYTNVNVISYTSGLFINSTPSITEGRLNASGLWLNGNQSYVGTLGFSRSFTIPVSGYYYFGIGTDDYSTITIDGTDVIIQDANAVAAPDYLNDSSTTKSWYYRYWNIYPVYLESGLHTIKVTTTSYTGLGILGLEIYNATEEELVACTTEEQLDNYIIFSTKNITDGSLFDVGNYYCENSDYELVYDTGTETYYCRKIETTQPTYI